MLELDPPVYVADQASLEKLAKRLLTVRSVAMDCEANSFHAYRERLCLLQVSFGDEDYIVDPLADGLDLRALAPVFADPAVLKVFHSAEFDVILLKRAFPLEFHGLFDTRVAAASLGLANVGLAPLLEEHFGVETDKKFQRSDWGKRPLDDDQLEYARRDTRWLLALAGKLRKMLHEAGPLHLQEVAAECRRLEALEPDPRPAGPDESEKIKGMGKLDARRQMVVHELNAWRHGEAARVDKPLYKIVGNEQLLAIAKVAPKTVEHLRDSRVVSDRIVSRFGADLVAAVRRGLERKPVPEARGRRSSAEPPIDRDVYEVLREWRRDAAQERNVDASLVLARSAMEAIARMSRLPTTLEDLQRVPALERWRVEKYGPGILQRLASMTGRR
jgi:ribonuclease D